MIPILYAQNETDFTSNGLGKLSDAISCAVTEERNGQYELSMTYPITGLHFSEILMSSLIKAVPADGKGAQLFRVYHITKPINGIVEIDAEHVSYQLSHIPVTPFTANNVTSALTGLKENAAESCPFEFWTDKSTSANFSVKEPVSIRSRLGGTQGSILDTYGGGEYEFDNYTVKLHQNRGIDRGVTLRYGKNITDIKQEENIASTYTGIMPYWKGTNDSQEEYIITLTEKVLHSANASNFPYQRTIPLDLSSEFEAEPTQAQLRARAQAYMTSNNIGVPTVSIDVSFVALWQTEEYKDIANLERVNLCDTVTVYFPMLEISATAKVVKTVYNVLQDRYDSVELGDAKTTLAKTIRSDIKDSASTITAELPTKSYMQKALDRATQLLTGGLGGFVRYTLNADGEPQEILIMDTDDIQTAVNVIRLNKNGIGFSTNGYDGPFKSAWTIDGHFIADFIDTGNINASLITTGELLASLIKAGKIQSKNGKVYFDLDNNEIVCSKMTHPRPWDSTTGSDPGDVILEMVKKDISGHNNQWVSYAEFYKKNYEDYGLRITPPKSSSGSLVMGSPSEIYFAVGQSRELSDSRGGEVGLTNTSASLICPASGNYLYSLGVSASGAYAGGDFEADTIYATKLQVTSTKNRVVNTDDYNKRLLYSYEMATPIFGDVGQGVIEEDGSCVIEIDDVLQETVNTGVEYQVFLQKEGPGDLYVGEKHKNYFTVCGTPHLKFVWEIKVAQRDYELERLESGERTEEVSEKMIDAGMDYMLSAELSKVEDITYLYDDDLNEYIEEQEVILLETA